MYLQRDSTHTSTDSFTRFSSNNPFRQNLERTGNGSFSSGKPDKGRAFEEWVEKNKQLLDDSEEEEPILYYVSHYGEESKSPDSGSISGGSRGSTKHNNLKNDYLPRPSFPTALRTGSDSSVNYHRISNNPFVANTEEDSLKDSRVPSVVLSPGPASKDNAGTTVVPPPSYEEAAGSENLSKDFPREKEDSPLGSRKSSAYSSKPRRAHSDAGSRRHKHSRRSKEKKKSKKPEPVRYKNLDTIDKLDVSAFFGGGFHHDGPFDACTPHRNKNVKAAPVMAFPADGPNNSISGAPSSGNKREEQMNLAFGHYREPSANANGIPWAKTNKEVPQEAMHALHAPSQNPAVINFDTSKQAEPIHGSMSRGLGTSTFVDGAPAPKDAEEQHLTVDGGGSGRKKTFASRMRRSSDNLRGIDPERSRSRKSSDTAFEVDNEGGGNSLLRRVRSLKVNRN